MKADRSMIDFVIYHSNCVDGFGAAWSAWKFLGNEAEYYAASHGDDPPDVTNRNVIILDFSYPNKTIKKMISESNSLTVLDHHKSAMIDLSDIPSAYFDMSHSGAVLAWKFFHSDNPTPRFIEYIEDRDLWKWSLPHSKAFSAGLSTIPLDFESFTKLESDDIFKSVCERGSNIMKYIESEVEKISNRATPRTWRGKKIFIVNSSQLISEVGSRLSPSCDFVVIWYFDHNKQKYSVSLRSFHENIDVSEVAKLFGGGGHKKAAGFGFARSSFDDLHIDDIFKSDLESYDIDSTGGSYE
jgi:uncharacterized protein